MTISAAFLAACHSSVWRDLWATVVAGSTGQGTSGSPFALTPADDVYAFRDDEGTVTRLQYVEFGRVLG